MELMKLDRHSRHHLRETRDERANCSHEPSDMEEPEELNESMVFRAQTQEAPITGRPVGLQRTAYPHRI